MTINYQGHGVTLHHGDALDVLRSLPDASVHAVVTDPPYGLEFMGKDWDAPWRQHAAAWATRDKSEDLSGKSSSPFLAAQVNKYAAGLPFQQWCELWAVECLRVLKPGGHLLAFGGTRTWHRLACAVEDAGFEIRDSIAWLYGSGFPKSLDVSKAIDKGSGENRARQLEFTAWMRSTGITAETINEATGTRMASHYLTDKQQPAIATADLFDLLRPHLPDVPEGIERLVAERTGIEWTDYIRRPVVGTRTTGLGTGKGSVAYIADSENRDVTAPATDAARQWEGWGTALKPAHEPVVVARKPLGAGTVAANVQAHGTGALNIDACRIDSDEPIQNGATGGNRSVEFGPGEQYRPGMGRSYRTGGRWPANVILDDDTAAHLDEQSGERPGDSPNRKPRQNAALAGAVYAAQNERTTTGHSDAGGASRFFFVAREDSQPCPTSPSTRRASTADNPSPQPNPPADSAPDDAATSAHHDTEKPTASPSTSATPSASRPNGETATATTPSTGSESSHDWQPAKPSQMVSPARYAASLAQTDTTTTTTSPSTSGGYADPTTSSTTPPSSRGVPLDEIDARFIYQAKAPKKERPVVDGVAHPTVKPLTLMRHLVRLVTPPGGTVLEPFAGSGTTVEACIAEGFQCIAIEKGDEYLPLIRERIRRATELPEAAELVRTADPEQEVAAYIRDSLFNITGEETA